MTPRETFEAEVREAFQPYFRLCETLDLQRLDEALHRILAAADQYAESEHKRRLSVAYARLLDVPVIDGPKRSDEQAATG